MEGEEDRGRGGGGPPGAGPAPERRALVTATGQLSDGCAGTPGDGDGGT